MSFEPTVPYPVHSPFHSAILLSSFSCAATIPSSSSTVTISSPFSAQPCASPSSSTPYRASLPTQSYPALPRSPQPPPRLLPNLIPFVPRKQATAAEWVALVNDFQKACLSTWLGIPMIYDIDAVHGHNNVYGATIFPHNVGLGATRDPNLVKRRWRSR